MNQQKADVEVFERDFSRENVSPLPSSRRIPDFIATLFTGADFIGSNLLVTNANVGVNFHDSSLGKINLTKIGDGVWLAISVDTVEFRSCISEAILNGFCELFFLPGKAKSFEERLIASGFFVLANTNLAEKVRAAFEESRREVEPYLLSLKPAPTRVYCFSQDLDFMIVWRIEGSL